MAIAIFRRGIPHPEVQAVSKQHSSNIQVVFKQYSSSIKTVSKHGLWAPFAPRIFRTWWVAAVDNYSKPETRKGHNMPGNTPCQVCLPRTRSLLVLTMSIRPSSTVPARKSQPPSLFRFSIWHLFPLLVLIPAWVTTSHYRASTC